MTTGNAVTDDFGVLVIRVWTEQGAEHPFRARITYSGDDPQSGGSAAASDPEDVLEAVRRWLDERAPHEGTDRP